MLRVKNDGHHTNYYVDHNIYDKLKSYADEKGQSMMTAITRILEHCLVGYNAKQKDENDNPEGYVSMHDNS